MIFILVGNDKVVRTNTRIKLRAVGYLSNCALRIRQNVRAGARS